ncbi:MATE family efflux transporter [Clostridium sp. CF012]|uniref:MATE family efflux transporter n=1 Tax=Clostridium sp. CF012 TaxID=2843319 RepID=UPI001C0C45F6|nr:MATE family efflux transporter [Clostridium sp. CF012]MBU3142898.1 MATE family efflux transporter [Clostridium sp. CF012]
MLKFNAEKSRQNILYGNIAYGLISISLPMMLVGLIQSISPLIDNLFVSRVGDTQLASINFVSPIIAFVTAFAYGLGNAGITLIGQKIGKNDKDSARDIASQLIIFSALGGVVFSILLNLFGNIFLKGLHGELLKNTQIYLTVTSIGISLSFIHSTYVAIRRAYGDSLKPLYISLLLVILKIAFTYLFVIKLQKSIFGAALATLITNLVIAAYEISDLYLLKDEINLYIKGLKLEKNIMVLFVKLGMPSAISNGANSLSFILINGIAIGYGEAVLTAYGIANTVNGLCFGQLTAIGIAVSTMVSQNAGANNISRAKKISKQAMGMSTIFSIIFALILLISSRSIAGLFTKNPLILYNATNAMRIYSVSIVAWAIFQVQFGVFIGLGKPQIPLYSSVLRVWVFRVPFIYLCQRYAPNLNELIIWYSMIISNFGVTIYTTYKYIKVDWNYKVLKAKN